MFTNRRCFGIFASALTCAASLSLPPAAFAQTYTIELINPPVPMGSAKIKDISDDRALIVQRLDNRDQVMEDLYYGFSMGTYQAPMSLSFLGLDPGGLERGGRFAVGSLQSRATTLDLMTLRTRTIHPPSASSSFLNSAQGFYGAGWVREASSGIRHAAEWGIVNPIVVNDLHPLLVQQLGPDWFSSELLDLQVGNGFVGWGLQRNVPGHQALGIWGGVWVNLHPIGLTESEAVTMFNEQQAGWGRDSQGLEHALVWRQRNAGSAMSLNPPGNGNSRAQDMDSEGIAGYTKVANVDHAAFWRSTTLHASGFGFVDLHAFLPPGAGNSVTTGITSGGVIAGHFQDNGIWRPVLWHPIHLTGLTLNKTFVRGGSNIIATVRISRPAPTGGVVVNVGPRNGLFVRTTVSTVAIPAGQTQASFNVATSQVLSRVSASVSATLVWEQAGATVTLDPGFAGFP